MDSKKQYDEAQLERLKKAELEILKDFIRICEKYKLKYFATGGTAIGALRHKGFIPWDDDIDVCMLREEYDYFMKVAPREMGDKYIFMTTETEKKYPLMFGKMVKRGTRFVEEAYQQADYPLGIYIDIFPYDRTPADEKLRKRWQKKTWQIARIHVLTLIPNPKLPDGMNPVAQMIARIGCGAAYYLLKLLRITPEKTSRLYLKWATHCPERNSNLYIDYSYITGENLMIDTRKAFPTIEVPFEDTTVSMVKNYDEFLRPEYGDYMELPPEDQRHNHYAAYIDFGEEKDERIIHDK